MKRLENEIDFLKEKKRTLETHYNNYVANYHHSMVWIATIALGFASIQIAIGKLESIWTIVWGYIFISSYRLFAMYQVVKVMKKQFKMLDDSIDKRYLKMGLDVKELKKEVNLK